MVRAIELVGSAGSAYYLTFASINDGQVHTPDSKVVAGKTYWLMFDFDGDGNNDNRFEGSVESTGHYYAVWPSLHANSKINLLRQVGPDNLGAKQVWVETHDGTINGNPVSQLPGTEPYPPANP
jgi:hypothetical protein